MIKQCFWFALLPLVILLGGCGIYSFSGASIDPGATTVNVKPFQNKAPYVNPTLAQTLTDGLRQKVTGQGGLAQVNSDEADYIFESTITDYSTSTVAVQNIEQPATARLTVSVKVVFTSNANPKNNFTQTFSRSEDFAANKSLQQVQGALVEEINKQLIDDIFNRAFVNW